MFHLLSSCFTAGVKTRDGQTGKSKAKAGKTHRIIVGREQGHANGKPQTRKNGGDGRKGGRKRHEQHETDKKKIVLCRVVSELSLVPASLCHSIRHEEDFVLEMLTA